MKNKTLFAFFDGDNIGSTIEALLLTDKVEEARVFSNSLNQVISEISAFLSDIKSVEIIILGGDDILIKLDEDESEVRRIIDSVVDKFTKNSQKSTISCGVGADIEKAIIALDRAKLFGKNQIFYHK